MTPDIGSIREHRTRRHQGAGAGGCFIHKRQRTGLGENQGVHLLPRDVGFNLGGISNNSTVFLLCVSGFHCVTVWRSEVIFTGVELGYGGERKQAGRVSISYCGFREDEGR